MSFQPRGHHHHHHHHHHHRGAATASTLDIDPISPSFMKRVKLALRIPFCFRGHHCINEQDGSPTDVSPYHDSDTPTGGFSGLPSSTTNSRPKNHRHGFSGEICVDGYKGVKSRMGRHRRGYSMGDFQYDALSYKLNFEDPGADAGADNADDLRYRSFSTRFSVVGSPRKALHDFS